jgi:NADH-quinone oxidoreductase subunit M
MVAHGFLAALAFAVAGYLYQHTGTLQMDRLGGLLKGMPFMGTILMMAAFAGCGLPGFANFAGEVAVFFGAWKIFPVVTMLACWGALVIGAIYMLRAVRTLLHGPLSTPISAEAASPHWWRQAPFVILVAGLLIFGWFPSLLVDKIKPRAAEIALSAPAATPRQALAGLPQETTDSQRNFTSP